MAQAQIKYIPIEQFPVGMPELAFCSMRREPGAEACRRMPFPLQEYCRKKAVIVQETVWTDPKTGAVWTMRAFYCEEHNPVESSEESEQDA